MGRALDEANRFVALVHARSKAVFEGGSQRVETSMLEGSEITGAPGQPVDTANLKNSFEKDRPEEWLFRMATGVEYAPAIEEGIQEPYEHHITGETITPSAMTLRSQVGGFHSRKLTVAGWQGIVDAAVVEAKAEVN